MGQPAVNTFKIFFRSQPLMNPLDSKLLSINSPGKKRLITESKLPSQLTSDDSTLWYTLGILRECVAARSAWRKANIVRMVGMDAAETAIAVVADNEGLTERARVCAFWLLAALATKGA